MKNVLIAALVAVVLAAAGGLAAFAAWDRAPAAVEVAHVASLDGLEAVLYKSPTCSCCGGYAEALAAAGVRVREVPDDELVFQVKRDRGVPPQGYSCHTIEMEGYVLEGHVPIEALEKLVAERPAIDGLVLPGMPAGSPGMPGPQTAPIEVLELQDGALRPYVTL